jgi:glycogen phosphorylase
MTTNPQFTSYFENSADSMKESIIHQLKFHLAHDPQSATKRDWWLATAKAVQERIVERMMATQAVHNQQDVRRVYYLSLEFLMGRLFSNSLYNAGVYEQTKQALGGLGLDIEELRGEEYDMGLGNGGLGRLAACFLDSLATLDYPAIGYGIHYEFRSSCRTTGCATARRGKSCGRNLRRRCSSSGTWKMSSTTKAITFRAG